MEFLDLLCHPHPHATPMFSPTSPTTATIVPVAPAMAVVATTILATVIMAVIATDQMVLLEALATIMLPLVI